MKLNGTDLPSFDYLISAAQILRKEGELRKAFLLLKKATEIQANSLKQLQELCAIAIELDNYNEAIVFGNKALAIEPKDFSTENFCALANLKLQNFDAAASHCKKAIQLAPDYKQSHNLLGLIYTEAGSSSLAIRAFLQATKIDQSFGEAYHNLAILLESLSQYETALRYSQKAVATNSNSAIFRNTYGNILRNLNQHDLAIEQYETAISINPLYPEAYNNLGVIYGELGHKDKALAHYESALQIDKTNVKALCNIVRLSKPDPGHPNSQMISELLQNPALEIKDKAALNFAMGNIYDYCADHSKAFRFFEKGNQFRFSELSNKFNTEISLLGKIGELFKNGNSIELLSEKNTASDTRQSIFILGMPRSGSTLIEQIVASHSTVYGGGELEILTNAISPTTFSENTIGTEAINTMKEKYERGLQGIDCAENIITDKMPANFQYIGLILLAFPHAKICHTIRNPIATCWSIYSRNFTASGHAYAYDLRSLGRYYIEYQKLMKLWHELFPGRIYDINYESLTENQEEETRKLLEYLDLEWEEACLNFHQSNRAVKTASYQQVREGMYQGSSKAWENYKPFINDLLEELG